MIGYNLQTVYKRKRNQITNDINNNSTLNIIRTCRAEGNAENKDSFVFVLSLIAIVYWISQEVCRQMDSVFKELLMRQTVQDPSSTASSPSAQVAQKKGRQNVRRGRGAGLFKAADPLDWEDWHQMT